VSRINSLNSKKNPTGPGDYKPVDELNSSGRYKLSRNEGIQSCVFSKSQREGPI
jgi:hypothetical protein